MVSEHFICAQHGCKSWGQSREPNKVPVLLATLWEGRQTIYKFYDQLRTAGLFINVKQGDGAVWCTGRVVRKDLSWLKASRMAPAPPDLSLSAAAEAGQAALGS